MGAIYTYILAVGKLVHMVARGVPERLSSYTDKAGHVAALPR